MITRGIETREVSQEESKARPRQNNTENNVQKKPNHEGKDNWRKLLQTNHNTDGQLCVGIEIYHLQVYTI